MFKKIFFVKWKSPIKGDRSSAILKVKKANKIDYEVIEVVHVKGKFHPTASSDTKDYVDIEFCEKI